MGTKQTIRKKLLAMRKELTLLQCEQAAQAVCAAITKQEFFVTAQNIAFYYPINNELDVLPIFKLALQQGKQCCFPVLSDDNKSSQLANLYDITRRQGMPKKQVKTEAVRPSKQLKFVVCNERTQMQANKYGILEPVITANSLLVPVQELSIILLPLVGFDSKGNRLGMGAGYYDATLAELQDSDASSNSNSKPVLLGVAYSFQEVESVPVESWDVRLDRVIT